jgi:hypothetical protein
MGYKVYRFDGAKFMDVDPSKSATGPVTQVALGHFLTRLFKKHQIV